MAYRNGGGGGGGGGAYSEDERESRSGDDRPDSDLGDKPTYLLEHLATFTVNKESGIVYPADGMRRLLQLEKTTGIWSQKMQLCLDRQWVLIMDYESGNVIERFPASLIQEPTAFTSNGPMELYNNILVIIVGGSGAGSRSEMHIFQCQSISAVHLVEDLKSLRSGKMVIQHRESMQPPPRKSPQTNSGNNHRNSTAGGGGGQDGRHGGGQSGGGGADVYGYHHETDSEIDGINDETSSTSSEKYERDVTVLNHCFDDIEKFIARLQHAAAASRELERRRRNRKSKKKDPGEGLLTLRTKPPHEKEFIDIFAKFKLSFNLLAKLKAHIHDPNAPELVHFLFTPLALIVDASHDTYYDPNIPARVVNPLLTREAINLLINCVTSKETELWRSLGDAWTIPRDQWKGHVGSYHPVFFDGWSPDYSVMDELDNPSTPTIKRRIEPLRHYSSSGIGPGGGGGNGGMGDYDYDPQPDKYQSPGSPGLRDFSARSDISIDSIERNGGLILPAGVGPGGPGGNGPIPMVGMVGNTTSHHHHQQPDDHLHHHVSHHRSSTVAASAAAAAASGSGGNNNNNNGGVNAITAGMAAMRNSELSSTDAWLDDITARGGKIVQVTYPRTANNDKELTVVRGEYLEILDDSRKWWKARNSRGQVAHVPHTIIAPFNYNDSGDQLYTQNYNKNFNRQANESMSSDRYSHMDNGSPAGGGNNAVPLPPSAAQAEWVRNKHTVDNGDDRRDSFSSTDENVFLRPKSLYQQQQRPPSSMPKPKSMMIMNNRTSTTPNGYNIADPTRLSSSSSSMPPIIAIPPPPNHQAPNPPPKPVNGYHHQDAPPPPPPPPPITPVTPTPTRPSSRTNTASRKSVVSLGGSGNQDEMQEELKTVLTLFREKRRNLDIVKTPDLYIQQSSKWDDVEKWLVAKGFSEKTVKKLNGLNGNELFALKRHTLEDSCGPDEGKRLASQITIQRNISGYKTARSTELQAILAKAREKTDATVS